MLGFKRRRHCWGATISLLCVVFLCFLLLLWHPEPNPTGCIVSRDYSLLDNKLGSQQQLLHARPLEETERWLFLRLHLYFFLYLYLCLYLNLCNYQVHAPTRAQTEPWRCWRRLQCPLRYYEQQPFLWINNTRDNGLDDKACYYYCNLQNCHLSLSATVKI